MLDFSVTTFHSLISDHQSLNLDEKRLTHLIERAKDFSLMHGICMRRKTHFDRDGLHFAPFVLFPSPFPETEFDSAVNLQLVVNKLFHKVAHDDAFLRESLRNTVEVDEFTARLWDIHQTICDEGSPAQVSLGMMRSDYMLDNESYCCWKQVELNTIASGFGWMGPASTMLHRYVLEEAGARLMTSNLPDNRALEGLAGGLVEAWRLYSVSSSVILFLIEDVTFNICDQRFHEFEIRKQCSEVFVIRRTLTQLAEQASLTQDRRLLVDGVEVGVIYMRCGYHPDQYPSEREWGARLMMERSRAIKSPSIHYHLAGTKKVQQELARPGKLERFLDDPEHVRAVRKIFTGLYSLDQDSEGDSNVKMALANPEQFVLKPQREGGGNNVYGEDIRPFLEPIRDSKERTAYILMDRIHPPVTRNIMVRPGSEPQPVHVISELGIFGYVIGDKDRIITNKQVGHTLRTKLSHVDEGGVAAGLGALDSVYLVQDPGCRGKSYARRSE